MDRWTIDDAKEYYLVDAWGSPYVGINESGHVEIRTKGDADSSVDLKELVESLLDRGISLPVMVRFNDILKSRLDEIHEAFTLSKQKYDYEGDYRLAMPIKVNQNRHVIEQILSHGRKYHVGLEAGSKPELYVAISMVQDPESVIVCNGFKDDDYLETALLARKLGKNIILVMDRFDGLVRMLDVAKRLGVVPSIGVRVRLASKGSGKWSESTGDKSKFGLSAAELVHTVQMLRNNGLLDKLELLHFHLGSQLTNIASVKNALRESCRIFVDISAMGANLHYFDVGGGLAVDYDGSRTNFHSSMNYSLQEYANDIIATIGDACHDAEIQAPTIISESGRAATAHHAVLIFDVLGADSRVTDSVPRKPNDQDHQIHHLLWEAYQTISRKKYQEAYNDLLEYRQQALSLYVHGSLDLVGRAYAEEIAWACAQKIRRVTRQLDYVPMELDRLEKDVSDTYFGNFSVFQSVPDHWAIKQLFPIMPIHRLKTRPTRPATLADLTCDSDGKIDNFIALHDVSDTILLHEPGQDPYFLAVFLVGAYQEVLGDLHNLFGDTNTVHVSMGERGPIFENVLWGDSVAEVLDYLQYDKVELEDRLRIVAENAISKGFIEAKEVKELLIRFENGLEAYTYLEA